MLCEKSGAILLVLVGLMTGRPTVRQNTGVFENSLQIVQCYYSATNGF